jgi:hypothetical protein
LAYPTCFRGKLPQTLSEFLGDGALVRPLPGVCKPLPAR